MNTVARHERPSWTIVYDRDSQQVVHGRPGEWATYARIQDIDGLSAYVLRDDASAVLVHDGVSLEALSAPTPSSFFSFSRFRSTGGEIHEWLYTIYGYVLPDYRVYLTVLPSHTEYHCEPRSTPFTLL